MYVELSAVSLYEKPISELTCKLIVCGYPCVCVTNITVMWKILNIRRQKYENLLHQGCVVEKRLWGMGLLRKLIMLFGVNYKEYNEMRELDKTKKTDDTFWLLRMK